MCTVPSGATLRMSSLVLVELNVIEWSPRRYQITDPPTGILIVFGPNDQAVLVPLLSRLGERELWRLKLVRLLVITQHGPVPRRASGSRDHGSGSGVGTPPARAFTCTP